MNLQQQLNINGSRWQVWGAPLLVFTLLTTALAIFLYNLNLNNYWAEWALGNAGMYEEFCERNRMDQLIREPANTWSNMAFVLYGFFCLALAYTDWKQKGEAPLNQIIAYPAFSILIGISLVYLGFGSFWYHASLTRLAQQWDMGGTYAVLAMPIMYNLYRTIHYFQKSKPNAILAYLFLILTVVVDILFFVYKWQLHGGTLLPIMIVTILITTVLYHVISKTRLALFWGILGFLSVVIAYTIWQLDVQKIWCNENSWLQGHAIWHVLTGLSVFSIYLLLRSEKN